MSLIHPLRKNRATWIDVGYFGSTFYVGFVPNEIAWYAEMKRLNCHEEYPTSTGCCTAVGQGRKKVMLVTFADTLDPSNGLNVTSVILHECVHVFQWLCEHIGEVGKPSKEFEAYMIQHIYGDIADAYARSRRDPFKIKYKGR